MMYRLLRFLHPLFHRRGVMEACWICAVVWRRILREPGFVADLNAGLADLQAGRVHRWSDIRREPD